jgi:hypothetical protein
VPALARVKVDEVIDPRETRRRLLDFVDHHLPGIPRPLTERRIAASPLVGERRAS